MFLIFLGSSLADTNDSGLYQPDHSGLYKPDHSGLYQPDNSGKYVSDHTGLYVPDSLQEPENLEEDIENEDLTGKCWIFEIYNRIDIWWFPTFWSRTTNVFSFLNKHVFLVMLEDLQRSSHVIN